MKNKTYSRRSQTVSTVKKSQARIVPPCWRRNDSPTDGGALRRRRNAGAGEHVSHQRRRHGDPELAQLADDPGITPVTVLPRQS
jgi:hypothetical protein